MWILGIKSRVKKDYVKLLVVEKMVVIIFIKYLKLFCFLVVNCYGDKFL